LVTLVGRLLALVGRPLALVGDRRRTALHD